MTTIGIQFDDKTCIILNCLVGGPAFNSKKVLKGDTILTIDGQDPIKDDAYNLLKGIDKPDSVVSLGLKRASGILVMESSVQKSLDLWSRRKVCGGVCLCVNIKSDSLSRSRTHSHAHTHTLSLCVSLIHRTAEMLEESEHDENIAHNIRKMQETSSVWSQELLQILEGRGSSDDEDDQVQYSQSEMEGKEHMEVVAQDRKDEALDAARNQMSGMSEMAKTEKDELNRAVESEKKRRTEQASRIVQRLLHSQLAQSFDSFCDRVDQLRDKKAMCKRMIQRMLHTHQAAGLDCFSEAIRVQVAHWTTVTKTISRWRTPVVKEMFERWLEYLDVVCQEVQAEAHAQAKQQIADELAQEKGVGEERVSKEKQRRTVQAKQIVQRLLYSQLAQAFDTYAYRALEVRRQGETCRRAVLRMQRRALAGAFDMFLGTVRQLRAHLQKDSKHRMAEKEASKLIAEDHRAQYRREGEDTTGQGATVLH